MDTAARIAQLRNELANAESEFSHGNADAYQHLYSHSNDVSIFGAFGGYEQGWDLVGPRLAWAAGQFEPGTYTEFVPISETFGVDVAYQVWLQRGQVTTVTGSTVMSELRVTHVYRLEDDRWRIAHRHADPLVTKGVPT